MSFMFAVLGSRTGSFGLKEKDRAPALCRFNGGSLELMGMSEKNGRRSLYCGEVEEDSVRVMKGIADVQRRDVLS